MAEKNRQHYVPKFYLRNFSDSVKAIDTYNITNSKYIPNASIKDMCQKHNFYGADKKMENFLNEEIEAKASSIIRRILDTNEFPNNMEDYLHLVMFLLVSEARNLKHADSTNNMADYVAKTIMKEHPDFKNFDLEEFKIELNEPANHSIEAAIEGVRFVHDLVPLLIVEQTGARRFITSDNPLIRYNSFYITKRYPGGFGYINRGMQFFFPISSQKCILLYDSLAYEIPEAKDGVLTLRKARDVDQLNEFFYFNAYNNVFFNQKTKKEYIEGIHFRNSRTPKIKELEREISSFKSVDSDGKLIHFSQNKISKRVNFSWIKISKYANDLKIPSHMGGINRTENHFIREFLQKEKIMFEKNHPSFKERYYRADKSQG
ncbi:DUF4238 domain-containing protein [uncultured Brevibacillus sp.]|uniref:DUF4238 domain-containing protein n=1 Tax=uncultured Brevibacillus sp. TaxID=169970 RepID=UPI0025950BBF|nr:DUF4238 domain-containing protein [uncultured Brevibacillus sp.]